MKIKIEEGLKIMLPNGNMLSLTPNLWNEYKWSRGQKRWFGLFGKWAWYLIAGHCEKSEEEFRKVILELYDIKIIN